MIFWPTGILCCPFYIPLYVNDSPGVLWEQHSVPAWPGRMARHAPFTFCRSGFVPILQMCSEPNHNCAVWDSVETVPLNSHHACPDAQFSVHPARSQVRLRLGLAGGVWLSRLNASSQTGPLECGHVSAADCYRSCLWRWTHAVHVVLSSSSVLLGVGCRSGRLWMTATELTEDHLPTTQTQAHIPEDPGEFCRVWVCMKGAGKSTIKWVRSRVITIALRSSNE